MATIEYSSTSHIEVKPTIVEMTFSIRVSDDDPNKSITKFNDCVTKLKKRIMKKKSYREDTYKQQNIDFRKNVIIVNKTPVHTAKTKQLKYLYKNGSEG